MDYANVLVSVWGQGGVKMFFKAHPRQVNVDFIVDKAVMVRNHAVLHLI